MKLLIVADGARDEASLPPLIESILGRPIEFEFKPWGRLHHEGSQRGYGRKLAYSIGQARSRRADGLVAVVDRDKDRSGQRGRDLTEAREAERQSGREIFPTVLGVADPHVDVWLLDDPVAVRQGLGLSSDAEIINVRREKDPKGELDKRIGAKNDRDRMETLKAIAAQVSPKRCAHASETGLKSFVEDCQRELANLPK